MRQGIGYLYRYCVFFTHCINHTGHGHVD
jgi:hypothetical protein